jgi:hypothetical protein
MEPLTPALSPQKRGEVARKSRPSSLWGFEIGGLFGARAEEELLHLVLQELAGLGLRRYSFNRVVWWATHWVQPSCDTFS